MYRSLVAIPPRYGYTRIKRHCNEIFLNNAVSSAGAVLIGGTNTNSMLTIGTITATTGWGYYVPWSLQFTPANLQNWTELSALFDQYRIRNVKVTWTYQHNTSTASGTSGLPIQYWVEDHDDSAPVGMGALRERMGLRHKAFTSDAIECTMYVRPTTAGPLYDGATGSYASLSSPWCDCGALNVSWTGLKGVLCGVQLPATADVVTSFKIDVEYDVEFKSVQ